MLPNQAKLAAHSTQGKQILVDINTEYIQTYRPAVVVRAVAEVVEKVRSSRTWKAQAIAKTRTR